jgi:hypothetical protein
VSSKVRQLLGILILLIYLTIYCLAAMGVAANYVLEANRLVQGLYFVVAGIVWLPPAMWLIKWMQRSDRESDA